MTEPNADALAAFKRLLETASGQGEAGEPVALTDALLGPELGIVLRRCAVPHEFDRELLQLLGGWSEDEAERRFRDFSELSIMQFAGDALIVHERWRKPLWSWWLGDERRAEFAELSGSLADWFGARARAGSETDERRQMFHLVGCRQDEGLQMFEDLCRRARHRRSFSECSLLIRLVNEYDAVLSPHARTVVAYHDGKLASDLRDWERAFSVFRNVAEDPAADSEQQVFALVREGHALRELGRTDEALAVLERARDRSTVAAQAWRALYELGEIYRDVGEADLADRMLRAALDQATKAGEGADVAGVLNSLGKLQRRLRDVDGAIESFRQSLEQLERTGDVVRQGAVLNNLGLAQMERVDWNSAEASFSASLESTRASSDHVGQAIALMNLSRVQSAQEKIELAQASAVQAGVLYEAVGEGRGQARALLLQARLAKREGHADTARSLFEQAIEHATAAGDAAFAGRAGDELSRV